MGFERAASEVCESEQSPDGASGLIGALLSEALGLVES